MVKAHTVRHANLRPRTVASICHDDSRIGGVDEKRTFSTSCVLADLLVALGLDHLDRIRTIRQSSPPRGCTP